MKLHAPPIFLPFSLAITLGKSALAQTPPCPPPGLEKVVDTEEKCLCFYSLAGSGLDLGNELTFSTAFTDDTIQEVTETGSYYGVDGIAEYLSFVKSGGEGFTNGFIRIGTPLFLDMTGSTVQQCVATIVDRRRVSFNSRFLVDNQEACVDTLIGNTLYYKMTGIQEAPITVQRIKGWVPNELFSILTTVTDTKATAEYVCDVLVNSCDMGSIAKPAKKSKKGKAKKVSKSSSQSLTPVYLHKNNKKFKKHNQLERKNIAKCVVDFNALPLSDSSNKTIYLDGNSRGCRIQHAFYASSNPDHCPHVSFEADEDVNGLVKCTKSKLRPLTDLFSEKEVGLFLFAGTMLGLGESGIDLQMKACQA